MRGREFFQIPHDVIGGEIGHEFVVPVKALSSVEPEGERDRLRKVASISGREVVIHGLAGYIRQNSSRTEWNRR